MSPKFIVFYTEDVSDNVLEKAVICCGDTPGLRAARACSLCFLVPALFSRLFAVFQ